MMFPWLLKRLLEQKVMIKGISYIIAIVIIIYALVISFPEVFFKYKTEYETLIIYSQNPLPETINSVLSKVYEKISNSELFVSGVRYEIFICKGFGSYTFFAPFCRKSFACAYPFTGKIFIASADFEKNKAMKNTPTENTRTLDSVIAHEITHNLIKNKTVFLKYMFLQDWKNEGYAEYIAGSGILDVPRLICDENTERTPALKYLEYKLAIDYLINDEKMTFKEIFESNVSFDSVMKKVKLKVCR